MCFVTVFRPVDFFFAISSFKDFLLGMFSLAIMRPEILQEEITR